MVVLTTSPGLQWRAGQLSGQTRIPAQGYRFHRCPSMEGRTIVRPDKPTLPRLGAETNAFNGGPDNCPARPDRRTVRAALDDRLQWRAGQLSGQTDVQTFSTGNIVRPSMEGRTIVRPDQGQHALLRNVHGGLQWRAGQLSGQTGIAECVPEPTPVPSMEGRTIVRPDPLRH